ncbi:hypothetical protein [uncultured Porphyromonas sp.]|uniref:hypothetical protein n=1 Tax=uncultured Porphyromonas sp. TaxID=159274 RepID=UPI0026077DC7|nr:hypothetical protein [uncultured Porphyromonas sp.]
MRHHSGSLPKELIINWGTSPSLDALPELPKKGRRITKVPPLSVLVPTRSALLAQ